MFRIEENCVGCGICKNVCELDLITVGNNYIEIDIEKCNHCSKCVESCPNGVFTKSVIMKQFVELFKIKVRKIFK